MSLMLPKTYDALRAADGVSEEQARAAAEEIATFDTRLVRVEIKLNLLITLSVSTLVGIGMLVIRLFLMD